MLRAGYLSVKITFLFSDPHANNISRLEHKRTRFDRLFSAKGEFNFIKFLIQTPQKESFQSSTQLNIISFSKMQSLFSADKLISAFVPLKTKYYKQTKNLTIILFGGKKQKWNNCKVYFQPIKYKQTVLFFSLFSTSRHQIKSFNGGQNSVVQKVQPQNFVNCIFDETKSKNDRYLYIIIYII